MKARRTMFQQWMVFALATVMVALGVPTAALLGAEEGGEGPFGFPLSDCTKETVEVEKFDDQNKPVKDQDDKPVTEAVTVRKCNGKARSFDGVPLSATLTLPIEAHLGVDQRRPLPLIVMRHQGGGKKTEYQQNAEDGPPAAWKNNWNDVVLAKRGYAVLTHTARGWHDSCGPKERANPEFFAQECEGPVGQRRAYWAHIFDPRWEVRDAQTLIGMLVDGGWVLPKKIGVTGFSSGGMETWLLALLNNRTMHLDGTLHPWRSPQGTPLRISAAIPEATFAAPAYGYAPNGRARDDVAATPEQLTQPFGVVLGEAGALCGLILSKEPSLAPPGADPTADWVSWCRRLLQGNPFRADPEKDPVLAQFVDQMRFRSVLRFEPASPRVPVFMWQGLTDALTPGIHGVLILNRLRGLDPSYPIKASFHDAGHAPAASTEEEYAPLIAAGHAFFDYHLRGQGEVPSYDVSASSPRCDRGEAVTLTKPRWSDLSAGAIIETPDEAPAVEEVNQSTTSHVPLPSGIRNDVPQSKPVCPAVVPAESAGAPTWTFPAVTAPYVLAGAPELSLSYTATGTDPQISVRLWDVAPDGLTQKLVSRGVYRHEGVLLAGGVHEVSFQLWPQVWPMETGHRLRLEVTGNDMPYLLQNNTPFVLGITSVALKVPRA